MEGCPTVSCITNSMSLSRQEIFDLIRSSNLNTVEGKLDYVKEVIAQRSGCPENKLHQLYQAMSVFSFQFKKRWANANRMADRFVRQNKTWLQEIIKFINYNHVKNSAGRPKKIFTSSSGRTKRKKTEDLRSSWSTQELAFATQMNMRASGDLESSKLVKEITTTTPTRSKKYRDAYSHFGNIPTEKMSGEEALNVMIDAKLTRQQYEIVRSKDKARFPSYKVVQLAKRKCYPSEDGILATDWSAEVKLQALLDHTVTRRLSLQEDVLQSLCVEDLDSVLLTSKWGFDGTSGNSEYKQTLDSEMCFDASVFITSLVPIQLTSITNSGDNIIIWQNSRPSSTRFCRPLNFQFAKEGDALVSTERAKMDAQINDLKPSIYTFKGKNISVKHKLLLTMVDGKICNYMTENKSTQRCYVCRLSSKDFNNLEMVDNVVANESTFEFGLSILHGWIRFFESLLHISYRLTLKPCQWQLRGEANKAIVTARKTEIQQQFRSQMGFIVDKPKPGFGSSNDGNTARFFENVEMSSRITGVDENLIYRFGIIMKTLTSGYKINLDKFKEYTRTTAELFIKLYPWYPMPTSVHKILLHGAEIIAHHAFLPIGMLSEEAQEARNKDFKLYRRDFSRKMSRRDTNEDIIHSLLISSDPVMSNMRSLPKKKVKSFRPGVLAMLQAPEIVSKDFAGPKEDPEWDSSSDECSSSEEA